MYAKLLLVVGRIGNCPTKAIATTFAISKGRVVLRVFVLNAKIVHVVITCVVATQAGANHQTWDQVVFSINVAKQTSVKVAVVTTTVAVGHGVTRVVETFSRSTCITTKFVIYGNNGWHPEGLQYVVFVVTNPQTTIVPLLTQHLAISELQVFTNAELLGQIEFRVGAESVTFEVVVEHDTRLILSAQAKVEAAVVATTGEAQRMASKWSHPSNRIIPVGTCFVGFYYLVNGTGFGVNIVFGFFSLQVNGTDHA